MHRRTAGSRASTKSMCAWHAAPLNDRSLAELSSVECAKLPIGVAYRGSETD